MAHLELALRKNIMTLPIIRSAACIFAATSLVSCSTTAPQQRVAAMDPYLKALTAYEYGTDRAPAVALSDFLTEHRSAESRAVFESQLALFAQDKKATQAARQHVIREMGRIGTAASAPALIGLLADQHLSNDAAMALARISDPDVGKLLRAALSDSSGEGRASLIALLGRHGNEQAAGLISTYLTSKDAATAEAAIIALAAPSLMVASEPASAVGATLFTVTVAVSEPEPPSPSLMVTVTV